MLIDRLVGIFLALLLGLVIGLWYPALQAESGENDGSDTGVGCTDDCLEPADDEKPYTPLMNPHPVPSIGSRWI